MSQGSTVTFFLDRALGNHYVAQALVESGATVEVCDDHFPQNCPDVVWLPEVSQRGWIVLTKDDNIGRNPLEQVAIAQSEVIKREGAKTEIWVEGFPIGVKMV
jgi:PIN like domain